jgi:Stealth protein CR2, conserved region 2/Stealth protein CR3, conserved region 3/Stealth protein CR4, conserved region 4/Stealth protein CR1, conserved region 1
MRVAAELRYRHGTSDAWFHAAAARGSPTTPDHRRSAAGDPVSVAFLITSPYQLFHYGAIAAHLPEVTAILEHRDTDFGLTESIVRKLLPRANIEHVAKESLDSLDGRFKAIVCQTPILPLAFLHRTLVIAQQYSLAKESYQYGVWRAHAHLNLMYGHYSVERVSGFSNAVAVGNPLLDDYFKAGPPPIRPALQTLDRRPRVLYMPTYGELSSLTSVLPHLTKLDVDLTVKLHHADSAEHLGALTDNVEIAHSDSDPVALFTEHDGVLSDYSGAAFDALYARLPVVLTGEADPAAKDYNRLSAADLDRSLISDITATWTPGDDLLASFTTAEQRARGPHRDEVIEQLFVNPGTAGEACAQAIQDVIEHGAPDTFAARQVREATKRYIVLNRQLRVRLARQAEQPAAGSAESVASRRRSVRGQLRALAGRSLTIRRVTRRLRSYGQAGQADLRPTIEQPRPPREVREEIWSLLAPHLHEKQVPVSRDSDLDGASAAVPLQHIARLHAALVALAASEPHLAIHLRQGARVLKSARLVDLQQANLAEANWIQIGPSARFAGYPVGRDNCLSILFVDYDEARQRYLALDTRAARVDWTGLFDRAGIDTADQAVAVGMRRPHVAAPTDVVYTWVDSNDPAWLADYARFSGAQVVHNPSANNNERYIDRDELRHSLRTLWMFAPFVRHIYIVTAGQRPSWLADHPQVSLVSHEEIFPNPDVLPTFNSHAIETCLHRIPGLAENFLYFNDDVFLGREVDESTFYTARGQAKVRLSPTQYIYSGEPNTAAIPTDWAAYNSLQLIERDFAMSFDRRVKHVPMPLQKSVLAEIEQKYPDEIERTRSSRFRATTDIALPSMLAQYYSIATSRAVEWPSIKNEYIYLDTGRLNSVERFRSILTKRPTFFCLNATKYTEVDLATQAANVREFLATAFPAPAPWESPADVEWSET